jgi:hypothetical protein
MFGNVAQILTIVYRKEDKYSQQERVQKKLKQKDRNK